MKYRYGSYMPNPWALILVLILIFAVINARLPKELSQISVTTLLAALKATYNEVAVYLPRWKQLIQVHSPDDGVPLIVDPL